MVGEEIVWYGAGMLRLEQCQQYQLNILLDTRMGRGRKEDTWHAGLAMSQYLPSYQAMTRILADNGVDDIVMFVSTDIVDLEWRPPYKLLQVVS